jgi:hypothetical protein
MKYVYYGFGGFIGFVCGTIINLIFYWVEQSGHPILSDLVNDYGMIGRYVVMVVNTLPFLGLGLGILMVRVMFKKELDIKGG